MAKALKTYTAEIDGINDWIVAAPNQKAVLEAFGVHQNLFAQGAAAATTDPALIKTANASPGVPLKRPKGGKGAFAPASEGLDWSKALSAAKTARPAPRKSRAKLDRAEAALARIEAEADAELADLEAEAAAGRQRLQAARDRLGPRVEKARDAVEAAEAEFRR